MKRSNLYLLILLFFVGIPFIILRFTYDENNKTIIRINRDVKVLKILNPDLSKENIIVDPNTRHFRIDFKYKGKDTPIDTTYLYYQLKNNVKYNPVATIYTDTMDIGKVMNAKPGETYKLKVRINGLMKIYLNDKLVWIAPYAENVLPEE